jgi:ubiquitin-conjugating enzyme E2 Z
MSKMITISKNTITRLIKDIKQLVKEPLHDQGIYYKHDEDDLLKGYAMLIGPTDTPYEHGFYLFELHFTADYPFSPPKLIFLTQDGVTRFNPNLYRSGKVCLSLLNTWRGEQWTSCQSISSILLVLVTIFNNTPLLNEPGVSIKHPDFDKYHDIITFKNFDIAIYNIITNKENHVNKLFHEEIIENYHKNYDTIKKRINNLKKINKNVNITTSIYNMKININYNDIYKKLIKNKIEIKE